MVARIHVGIDVSKDWFDACARHGRMAQTSRFSQNPEGVEAFLRWLKAFSARTVHVCMEHTGGYEMNLALACIEAGLLVSVVDGTAIARYRESFGRAKAKTDRSDAALLARYCKERKPALWSPRPEAYERLTELVRHREDLVGQRKAWSCRSAAPCRHPLVAAQRLSLGEVAELQIAEVDKAIRELVESSSELSEDVRLLDSIEGVAFKSAVRILAEMGPVANYNSPRELALHAGLAPIPYESGKSTGKCFLPIYGNRQLRNALYMPVIVAMRLDKSLAAFTKRVAANGPKHKRSVIVAGMRKLAHVVYGVLKHRAPYSPDIFLGNLRTGS